METIFAVAVCILLFGLISGRIERTILTPPMVFVAFGILAGRWGFAVTPSEIETSLVDTLATITLVLVLFTDASRIDLKSLRREHKLPVRLLGIGLPITILFGMIGAVFLLGGITFWEAALLAAILAPTDAALGQAVVNNPQVPVRIRQTLNIESGLNDGLALPIVLMFLSLAAGQHDKQTSDWLWFALLQVGLGPIAGIVTGYVGGQLVLWGQRTGSMNQSFQDISSLGLSLLAYSTAELIGGNGFIAAFVAGLVLGNTARSICKCLYEFAEAEGQLLTLLVFMVFGAVMLPDALEHFQPVHLVYAVLSLTIIRMLPVAISLFGSKLQARTVVFLGWFGPRGIASILYALLLLEDSSVPGGDVILSVVATTVLLSVILHGVTAFPGSSWYAAYVASKESDLEGKQEPSDERQWDVGFDRMPLIRFSDDKSSVEISNVRNFRYECDGSFEPNWETRKFLLDDVIRLDFIVVPFNYQPHLAHTMVSFGFQNGEYLTISVEARRPLGKRYSIVKGAFGGFPLTYVIADERDCIGVRTEYRQNVVHLYPSAASPQQAKQFLASMLTRADKLSKSPENYNTLFNNCLTNLRDHLNSVWPGRVRWHWKTVLTGHADHLAYQLGLLKANESFESLNAKATINDLAAGNWHRDDFSTRIRSRWGDEVCAICLKKSALEER